jgi:hypothetical protein
MFKSFLIRKGGLVAQQLSKASLVIRVLLIVVLLVMIGAFIVERRAAGAAKSAFIFAKEIVTARKDVATLQDLLGRKPDSDETVGLTREQRFKYKGVVNDYTVRVLFNQQASGEVGEEAYLDIFDKIKGKPADPIEDEAAVPATKKK